MLPRRAQGLREPWAHGHDLLLHPVPQYQFVGALNTCRTTHPPCPVATATHLIVGFYVRVQPLRSPVVDRSAHCCEHDPLANTQPPVLLRHHHIQQIAASTVAVWHTCTARWSIGGGGGRVEGRGASGVCVEQSQLCIASSSPSMKQDIANNWVHYQGGGVNLTTWYGRHISDAYATQSAHKVTTEHWQHTLWRFHLPFLPNMCNDTLV
jgi:hypothetical protein